MLYSLGDKVVTKKKHPCGNDVWTVVRVGADYKIRCDRCGRVVMLTAENFRKAIRPQKGASHD